MHLLLVSDAYPPIIGGATRSAEQLARQFQLRGHKVTVATAWQRGLSAREKDSGVDVHRLPGLVSRAGWLSSDEHRYTPPPFPDPELVWRLRRLIRQTRPDVVHSYGWLSYSVAVAMIGIRTPLILAAREYANVCPIRTLIRQGVDRGAVCDGPERAKCLECAGVFYGQPKGAVAVAGVLGGRHLLRRRTQALHSTSRFTQEMVHRHLFPSGSVRPDVVIPDFREDELTGPADQAILDQLPAEPYILFVGSFRRIKGDEVLLEAYRALRGAPPLVMIGARSPERLPTFPPGVTALFNVPHDTVMAAWNGAAFGVFPSVVPEALGNVVHEAMSRGRAVIGTRPGGHVDMIDDGVNGKVVPSGDVAALTTAMQLLIDEPALRDKMGRAAGSTAERYTSQAVMPAMELLFRDVSGG